MLVLLMTMMGSNMELEWKESQIDSPKGAVLHFVDCAETAEQAVFEVLAKVMNKAVDLLPENVSDDSRYFLCEWDAVASTLNIVVTDDHKQKDALNIVKLRLSGLVEPLESIKNEAVTEWATQANECSDNIKYFIRDYLTTSREFHQFSLIAVFHNDSRARVDLL